MSGQNKSNKLIQTENSIILKNPSLKKTKEIQTEKISFVLNKGINKQNQTIEKLAISKNTQTNQTTSKEIGIQTIKHLINNNIFSFKNFKESFPSVSEQDLKEEDFLQEENPLIIEKFNNPKEEEIIHSVKKNIINEQGENFKKINSLSLDRNLIRRMLESIHTIETATFKQEVKNNETIETATYKNDNKKNDSICYINSFDSSHNLSRKMKKNRVNFCQKFFEPQNNVFNIVVSEENDIKKNKLLKNNININKNINRYSLRISIKRNKNSFVFNEIEEKNKNNAFLKILKNRKNVRSNHEKSKSLINFSKKITEKPKIKFYEELCVTSPELNLKRKNMHLEIQNSMNSLLDLSSIEDKSYKASSTKKLSFVVDSSKSMLESLSINDKLINNCNNIKSFNFNTLHYYFYANHRNNLQTNCFNSHEKTRILVKMKKKIDFNDKFIKKLEELNIFPQGKFNVIQIVDNKGIWIEIKNIKNKRIFIVPTLILQFKENLIYKNLFNNFEHYSNRFHLKKIFIAYSIYSYDPLNFYARQTIEKFKILEYLIIFNNF